MKYRGGKNGSGVYQKIINQIPPHDVYIEPFLGGGAIMRLKKPARINLGYDLDDSALEAFTNEVQSEYVTLDKKSAIDVIKDAASSGPYGSERVFLYLDPPYPFDARKSRDRIYKYEFGELAEHARLLLEIMKLPKNWMIAISSYDNHLYNKALKKWRRIDFPATTRKGQATESLWMNYPEPNELHDYRYLGEDYREREKIKKQQRRWRIKLKKMDRRQRLAMMSVLDEARK